MFHWLRRVRRAYTFEPNPSGVQCQKIGELGSARQKICQALPEQQGRDSQRNTPRFRARGEARELVGAVPRHRRSAADLLRVTNGDRWTFGKILLVVGLIAQMNALYANRNYHAS